MKVAAIGAPKDKNPKMKYTSYIMLYKKGKMSRVNVASSISNDDKFLNFTKSLLHKNLWDKIKIEEIKDENN